MKRKPKRGMAYVTITWELPIETAQKIKLLYGKRKARKGRGK